MQGTYRAAFALMWSRWVFASLVISARAFAQEVEAEADESFEEVVEPVSVDEVLPNREGEVTARLSLGAILEADEDEAAPELVLVPSVQLFAGLTHRVGGELGISVSVLTRSATAQVSSLWAGIKVILINPEESVPGVAIKIEATPLGDEGPQLSTALGVVGGSGRLVVQGALGVTFSLQPGSVASQLTVSASFRVIEQLFLLAEGSGQWEFGAQNALTANAGPALKWMVNASTFLALSALVGMGEGADPVRVGVQLQHRL